MSISLNNHESRIKALESKLATVTNHQISTSQSFIDCKQYGDGLYLLSVASFGSCSTYGIGEFLSTICFDKNTSGTLAIHGINNQYWTRNLSVANGVVTFEQINGSVSSINGWLTVLKL